MYRRLIIILITAMMISLSGVNLKKQDLNNDRYIQVEIRGEVENPGIYELKLGSSLDDLLERAVVKKDGDISQYALNMILHNTQVIVIGKTRSDLISINTAALEELTSLPGIGEKIAQRIIDYRNTYGCFNYLEELMNVNGIGENKFNKIREHICL